jgi:hypothetical protein
VSKTRAVKLRQYNWCDRKIKLTLGTERRGKFNPKDRQEAVFFNIVAYVTEPNGECWCAGQAGELGLTTPGARNSRLKRKAPNSSKL